MSSGQGTNILVLWSKSRENREAQKISQDALLENMYDDVHGAYRAPYPILLMGYRNCSQFVSFSMTEHTRFNGSATVLKVLWEFEPITVLSCRCVIVGCRGYAAR